MSTTCHAWFIKTFVKMAFHVWHGSPTRLRGTSCVYVVWTSLVWCCWLYWLSLCLWGSTHRLRPPGRRRGRWAAAAAPRPRTSRSCPEPAPSGRCGTASGSSPSAGSRWTRTRWPRGRWPSLQLRDTNLQTGRRKTRSECVQVKSINKEAANWGDVNINQPGGSVLLTLSCSASYCGSKRDRPWFTRFYFHYQNPWVNTAAEISMSAPGFTSCALSSQTQGHWNKSWRF